MKCSLICFNCQATHLYSYSTKDLVCESCGSGIVDKEIRFLVFALNCYGIKTEKSCEGHDDFDSGYYPFPWLTILSEEDKERLSSLINEYNLAIEGNSSQWRVGFNVEALRYWLYPQDKHKETRILQEESKILAKFIISKKGK